MDWFAWFLSRVWGFLRALADPAHWTFGAVRHKDYLGRFQIQGNVKDASGAGQSAASVYFIDTGLDDVRSRDPDKWALLAGQGDATGKVRIDFDYTWGTVSDMRGFGADTFCIRVQRYGYQPHDSNFKYSLLSAVGDRRLVDLGDVVLAKR